MTARAQRKSATRFRRLRTRFAQHVAAYHFAKEGTDLVWEVLPPSTARSPRSAAPLRASPRKLEVSIQVRVPRGVFSASFLLVARTPLNGILPSIYTVFFFSCSLSLSMNFSPERARARARAHICTCAYWERERCSRPNIFGSRSLPNSISACISKLEVIRDVGRQLFGCIYELTGIERSLTIRELAASSKLLKCKSCFNSF